MNIPAHLLLGLAVCARRDRPRTGRFAAMGSLAPYLSLYLMAGAALFAFQIQPKRVFGELYFSAEWQTVFAIDNSFILWGAAFALAAWLRNAPGLAVAGAGLLHLATDFPLHNDDARSYFWPLTDWVFESPLSYWNSDHHAGALAPVTLLVVLTSAVIVWRRWHSWPARIGVMAICAVEICVVRQWLLFF